ncbi:phage portal protein [Dyadobacter chenwenxiniae]|uniref:Phage portal protein n=1 Tax=Dyadobacter chenwenxiniae TaxID=2906456 RepID=A0A9X1PG72_9BACT|nr:phage portal protein [Dyadobacter chenwenxiniae]MCF0060128.1 phage portal protein [Dyadobacter chenwenxiniae]UON85866.1 phage portal protein [Dyadobacter chenwenxiniae]
MANWLSNLIGRSTFVPTPAISIVPIAEERSVLASVADDGDVFLKKLGLEHLRAHVTAKNAMGLATFYGCVKFISNQIASLPYNVYRSELGQGAMKQSKHPLNYVLETRFNKNMAPLVAKRAMLLNCLVHGWSVAEIKRNRARHTIEIQPYPCSQVYILHDRESDSYFFDIPHLNKKLSQDDVIFLKDLDFDGATGGSIISWQHQTIEIDLTAKEFAAKFFRNGTFMGGIIENPAMANAKTEEVAKGIKSQVVKAFDNGDGIAVFAPGVKFHPIGLSPADSRLLEIFEMSDKDIAKMFNLSLSMIGDTEVQSSWGSGVEQMYTILTNSVLVPIARQIEEEVDYKCFRGDDLQNGYYTKHNFKGLLRGDWKTQSEHLQRMVTSGIYTPDEARYYDDMGPLPKGTGNRAYMNGTMTPLELIDEVKTSKRNGNKGASAGVQRG